MSDHDCVYNMTGLCVVCGHSVQRVSCTQREDCVANFAGICVHCGRTVPDL